MRTRNPHSSTFSKARLGERLAWARNREGLAQVELGVAMGDRYDQKAVSAVECGRNGLRLDGLANAAKELSVSTDWLLGLTDDPRPATDLLSYIDNLAHMTTEQRNGSAVLTDSSATDCPVRVLEVASVVGGCAEVYEETPIGALWFREDWLRERGINAILCNVIRVAGDSMEPTLPNGCLILVDRGRRVLHNRGIYVMRNEDGLIVRRVKRSPQHGWLLISDNIFWQIEVMDRDTDIIGEVMWYSSML